MNLNLEEHFDHLDLEIPHISPTIDHINQSILKPTKKPIEHVPTPSLQPTITHPIKKPTHKEPSTSKELQAPSTSRVQEGLHFDKMSWAWDIEENVQKILSPYKAQRK